MKLVSVLLPEEYLKGLHELVKSGVFPSMHGIHAEKETIESHEECKTPKKTLKQKGLGSSYFLFCDHSSECFITFWAFVVTYGKL